MKLLTILSLLLSSVSAWAGEGGSSNVGNGANGILGRPLESYVRDITTLTEYKQYVEPALLRLENKLPALANDLRYLERNKNSYFVPVVLNKIPDWVIGTFFYTDQMALQTESELWIDSYQYDRMRNNKDKATLLMHEMVIGSVLLQKNAFILCSRYGNCRHSRLYREDYENVRRLTYILLNRLDSTTNEELESLLVNMGYTSYHQEAIVDLSPLDQAPTAHELYMMLSAEQRVGSLPINTEDQNGCGYEFNFNEGNLEILIYSAKGGQPVLDSIPLRFLTNQTAIVHAQAKQQFLYTVTEPESDVFRKKLEITVDKNNISRLQVYWEQFSYDYRTRSQVWKRSSKGPVTDLTPNQKVCI